MSGGNPVGITKIDNKKAAAAYLSRLSSSTAQLNSAACHWQLKMVLLTLAILSALSLSVEAETILGAIVFTRHGDRTYKMRSLVWMGHPSLIDNRNLQALPRIWLDQARPPAELPGWERLSSKVHRLWFSPENPGHL